MRVMDRLSEVQLLVLLSFILQLFLFFTGGLRRRTRHWLLRSIIWIAYLAADVVAIYTLGFLSQQADAMHNDESSLRLAHPLAFLWAPFLLIHLGGQDTITAFAIEDNNLWLRHLLNLLLQVTLALYVFWKSSSWHSTQVLVPGILLFVAGIIKYGERTAALKHGNLNSTVIVSSSSSSSSRNNNNNNSGQHHWWNDGPPPFSSALRSALGIRMLFARRKTLQVAMDLMNISSSPEDMFRLMDVELGMVYSDLYTKAAVLRTKRGIVFRCISLSCTVAALVLFFFFTSTTYNTGGGSSRVDTVITYTLFIGGLVVDMCSLLTMVIASPWTWAWLQAHDHHRMASTCLHLISCCDMVSSGWLGRTTRTRPFWSNTMGQYRFVCYDDDLQPWTLPEQLMGIIRKLVVSSQEKKLFQLSKLLETKHVVVEDNVTKCLVEAVNGILRHPSSEVHQQQQQPHGEEQKWSLLGQLLLAVTQPECTKDFVHLICWLHACTEVLLCEAVAEAAATTTGGISADDDANANANANVCRKLSRYMTYLVAVHPAGASLLQMVSSDPDKEYKSWERYSNISLGGKQHQIRMGLLRLELEAANRGCGCGSCSSSSSSSSSSSANTNRGAACGCGCCCFWPSRILASSLPRPEKWQDTLKELKDMWARLLVYAAANSRPEAHAAELATGGELLTFVWLLLCHNGLGASFRVDLVPRSKHHGHYSSSESKTHYIFKHLPAVQKVVNNCCPQLLLPPKKPTDSRSCQPSALVPSRADP